MELTFRDDPYARSCAAEVLSAEPGAIRLSRSVFYPMGGGQPGDSGRLVWDGGSCPIADARKAEDGQEVVLIPGADGDLPAPGDSVTAEIDWPRRHRLMRMHTTLHLLCSLIEGEVTGGQIGEAKSRLDFNLADQPPDKDDLTARLNALIGEDHPVTAEWIDAEALAARGDLVRTMSVKPPTDSGQVRLIRIGTVDLQACGGTHVASTAEIGRVRVGKIENKGRQNRRINVHLDD
jgi:misacylated tRNA(Ala) deacylase